MNNSSIEFFYFDKYDRKISQIVNERDFDYYKTQYLEMSLVENIGNVYYTKNSITKQLDYYND